MIKGSNSSMKKNKNVSRHFLQTFIFLILYFSCFTVVGIYLDFTNQQFVYLSFLLIAFAFSILFSYFYCEKRKLFIFYNMPAFHVFLICFIIVFVFSNICIFLPINTIPFCLFALILVFSSNFNIGIASYLFIVIYQTIINNWDINFCVCLLFIG